MAETLVLAMWIGPGDAELPEPDRRTLHPGVDTALVGQREAETSANWLYPLPP
jgi:hypothetical protein